MKKIIATISLSLAAFISFAAGPTIGLSYDHDRANGNVTDFRSVHEGKLSVTQDLSAGSGSIDGGLLLSRRRGSFIDNANGFEFGYSNGTSFDQVGLKGRIGYGRMNSIDPNGGGFTGNQQYVSLGAEAAMPISLTSNGFVGYRHRNGLNSDTPIQNRYTVGVDFAVSNNIAVRVGYAHTRQAGFIYNGLTTGISYAF